MGLEVRAMAGNGQQQQQHHHHHHHQQQQHGAGTGNHQATPHGAALSLVSPLVAPTTSAATPFAAAGAAQSSSESDDWGDESWIVDCPCGVTFDDGDEMVECDSCCVWVHTSCCRVPKDLSTYVCDKCKSKKKSEEEVVQLLVDFPNTARAGNADVKVNDKAAEGAIGARVYASTDLPIEQRVHVQGVPGGDAKIFKGASKILRQLWQHSGYVPKTFHVEYEEFPDCGFKEIESCLFSLKSATEKALDTPLKTPDKPELSNLGEEKYGIECTENMVSDEQPSKKDSEGNIETRKMDSVRHSKNRQRLRGVKEDRLHQHGKHGREEGCLKDENSKKKAKSSPADMELKGDAINQQVPSILASLQMSPKNPKAMKKSAVQEFMDGDTWICSKCGKVETLLPTESLDLGPHDNPKSLLCKECEQDSTSFGDDLHPQDRLALKYLPAITDPLTNISNRPEVVEVKLEDDKEAVSPIESSGAWDKRKKGDHSEEVHLMGHSDHVEEKDHKADIKRKKLEGQQPLGSVSPSALDNAKKIDVVLNMPSTVLNRQASFTVGASFEEETSALPILSRKTVDIVAESTCAKARLNLETPAGHSSSQFKPQVEHENAVPFSTIASLNALSDSQCEDVLQPLSSGIMLESTLDEKQSGASTSRIMKDRNEEASKTSGHKLSVKEQPIQQPWIPSGISSQQQIEPQQDDPLISQTVEVSSSASRQVCGMSPNPDKHAHEALTSRSPHRTVTEADHQHDHDTMSPVESKPNIETNMQSGAQRHVTLHLDVKETNASSSLQSPKVLVQQQVPCSPGNQKTVPLSLSSKNSHAHILTKPFFVPTNKPPSISGVKSVATSTISAGVKNSSAAKLPVRVGSPQSRRPDSVSLSSSKSSSGVPPGGTTPSVHLIRDGMKPPVNVAGKTLSASKSASQAHVLKLPVSAPKGSQNPSISKQSGLQLPGKKIPSSLSSPKLTVTGGVGKLKAGQLNKEESLDNCSKDEKTHPSSILPNSKTTPSPSLALPPPPVTIPHSNATALTNSATTALNDEELALLLHQELNSSPRVPRVPRVRQVVVTSPQRVLSNQSVSGVVKGALSASVSTSAGGSRKENRMAWRKRIRDDRHKDGSNQSFVGDESNKSCEPALCTTPNKKDEEGNATTGDYGSSGQIALAHARDDGCTRETNLIALAAPSQQTAPVSFARSSLTVESGHVDNISGERKNPTDVPLTLSGLITEILTSQEVQVSYEDLCAATLPHWQKLRKTNGERCAYSTHRQAVFDCLKNNNCWAHLVDQAPKMGFGKRKRRYDSSSTTEVESEEDADLGSSYTHELLEFRRPGKLSRAHEGKRALIDKQKDHDNCLDDVPKGKRKARRRRKLAIDDETEDDEDYVEKVKKVPHKPVSQGKFGGGQAEEQDVPTSLSEEASSNSSEDEEEEMVVHRGVRRIRKRIEEGNSSEDDAHF